ncbi:TVP38/TMEM64 family protein [Sulfuriflexus mobilis]|uniref:TVP38/TMEM64 family protein n=1 Tax=Sulfuriflexus mobilis TaxID=1811807 RepID=UPI000F83A2F7|nr:VTT domain-containing protein [Sulfuriflexus mobilis]
MLRKHRNKLVVLIVLIAAGITLQVFDLFNPQELISIGRDYADQWWLIAVIILLQVLLFTFALAGSQFLWVAATLYPPLTATFILAAGATLGGLSAYLFSAKLTEDWSARVQGSRVYRLLEKQDQFFTLLAMRIMPAFPHSLINYSSGILRIKWHYFIPATIIGIGAKSYVYAKVIYNATSADALTELLKFSTYGPPLLISAFIITGLIIKYRLDKNRT